MGLFDRLVRTAIKTAANTLDDAVKTNVEKTVKENLGVDTNYSIPAGYEEFPTYPGNLNSRPIETKTNKYTRVTLNYNGSINEDFIDTLLSNGYKQGSKVRYDKNTTYVIVEENGNDTKIVYHIKK